MHIVVERFSRIALADIGEQLTWGPDSSVLRNSTELDCEDWAAVSEFTNAPKVARSFRAAFGAGLLQDDPLRQDGL